MPTSDYLSILTMGWADSAGGGLEVDMPSVGTLGWFEESTSTGVAVSWKRSIAKKSVPIRRPK